MTTNSHRIKTPMIAAISLLVLLCTTAYAGDDLYAPRFEKLNDQQRALLRECIAGQKKLAELYANYRATGVRTIKRPQDSANTRPFECLRRSDNYVLSTATMTTENGKKFTYGFLLRPDGYVGVSSSGNEAPPRISAAGVDVEEGHDHLSSAPFRLGPILIRVWRINTWLTEKGMHPKSTTPNIFIASDLIVRIDPSTSTSVATLELTMPSRATNVPKIKIDFLKDHLWAVSRVEWTRVSPSANTASGLIASRNLTEIEYDFSKPNQPRMTRFKQSDSVVPVHTGVEIDWKEARVTGFEDYRFDTLEFVTPDVEEFSPKALGLPNWYFLYVQMESWKWVIAGAAAVAVIFALFCVIRQQRNT